jgi:cell division protein FtsB
MNSNFPAGSAGGRSRRTEMHEPSTQSAAGNPRRLPWWSLGIIVVICAFALFGDRGILHLFKQKHHQAELQRQLAEVEAVNDGLRQEIASLSADRRHLERMARSQLGMVREDEVVYQFASSRRPAAPATTPSVR